MVKNGVINKEKARDIRGWSDGFTLAVNVTGSVMDYRLDSIEAVCFSLTVRLVSTWGLKTSNIRMLVSGGFIVPSQSFKNSLDISAAPRG